MVFKLPRPSAVALAAMYSMVFVEKWIRKKIHVALGGELLDAADVLGGVDTQANVVYTDSESYEYRHDFLESHPIADALVWAVEHLDKLEQRMTVRRELFKMLWEQPEDLLSVVEDFRRRLGSDNGIFDGSLGHTEIFDDGYVANTGDPVTDPNGGGIFSR